eukprot:1306583-Heterocapsa_arctica.AAC.1
MGLLNVSGDVEGVGAAGPTVSVRVRDVGSREEPVDGHRYPDAGRVRAGLGPLASEPNVDVDMGARRSFGFVDGRGLPAVVTFQDEGMTSFVSWDAPASRSSSCRARTTLGKLGSLGRPSLDGAPPTASVAKSASSKLVGVRLLE